MRCLCPPLAVMEKNMNIVATVNTNEKNFDETVNKLISTDINVLRFNLGKVEGNKKELDNFYKKIAYVRKISKKYKILVDLPYPGKKYRVILDKTCLDIKKEEIYYLSTNDETSIFLSKLKCEILHLNQTINEEDMEGKIIYVDLGQGAFKVLKYDQNYFVLQAMNDFILSNYDSLSFGFVPKVKYEEILEEVCKKCCPDMIALSFVESSNDLYIANTLKEKYGYELISKIETNLGMNNIKEIISKSDSIMFGRGDLSLYSEPIKLIKFQTLASNICKEKKCRFYLATGILTSISDYFIPLRSELIDLGYALDLDPDYLVLNVKLVNSDGLERALKLISSYAGFKKE